MTVGTALIFDTETTGLFDFEKPADAEGQPRLLSLAASLVNDQGHVLASTYRFVKPNGFTIDEEGEAFRVNQLSQAFLDQKGIPVEEVLEEYDRMVDMCDFIGAFSIRYDQKIIRAEQRRAGRDDRYGYRKTFEIMYKARKVACEVGGAHSNPKTLEQCYENIFGEQFDGAHKADKDRNATIDIYCELLARGLVEPKDQVSKK